MSSFFEKLRAQPEAARERVVLFASFAFTILLLALAWAFGGMRLP